LAAAVAAGVQATAHEVDLAQLPLVRSKIAQIIQDSGSMDILVNCAGTAYTNALIDTPLDDWQQIIDLNLSSVFQVTQEVLPHMRQQQSGTIINVISIAGQQVLSANLAW
jgi:NAD(P)-dependent dehydrogenase (short-subunit alcohol dehydrogenase family)